VTAHPSPRRDDAGRTLVSRQVVAYLAHRHVDQVRRLVPPVACDVSTRAALLDLDEAEDILGGRPHRNRSALVPLRPE
jgi:hypothetical protein